VAKKKIHTGQAAENAFVTGMGGELYKGQAGSQATDIIMSHPEHGDLNIEMKAGPIVDHQQMRMEVDSITGKLKQTTKSQQMSGDVASGKIHPRTSKTRNIIGMINRPFRGVNLLPGTQEIERVSRTTGKVKTEKRPAAMQQLGQADVKKLSMNNRNGVSMMHMGDDHAHIAIHHQTGKVALIPTKNDHAHIGDKMGLRKTITYDHFAGDDHGHKNTLGLKLRGARAKGSTVNVSLETSSGNMVNAVDEAGGHVFDSLDHAIDHLTSHGWKARSGHSMDVSPAPLSLGSMKESIQKLYGMLEQRGDEFTPTIGGPSLERTGGAFGNLMGRAMQAAKKKTDDLSSETEVTPEEERRKDETEDRPVDSPVDPTTAEPTEWDQDGDGVPDSIQADVPRQGTPAAGAAKDPQGGEPPTTPTTPTTATFVTRPSPVAGETQTLEPGIEPPDSGKQGPRTVTLNPKDETKDENFIMSGMDYFAENIKTTFLDYLKEKNIDLGIRGMIGDPVLKDPKKKKLEETAMLMLAPIAYRMKTEARLNKNNLINKENKEDSPNKG